MVHSLRLPHAKRTTIQQQHSDLAMAPYRLAVSDHIQGKTHSHFGRPGVIQPHDHFNFDSFPTEINASSIIICGVFLLHIRVHMKQQPSWHILRSHSHINHTLMPPRYRSPGACESFVHDRGDVIVRCQSLRYFCSQQKTLRDSLTSTRKVWTSL